MAAPPETAARVVTCPICLDRFPWDETEPLEYDSREGRYKPVEQTEFSNPDVLADVRRLWYIRCPNTSDPDSPNHYLPVGYADYPDPLVIALIGRPRSGKTHLVVAMIRELLNGSAGSGLRAKALDVHQNNTFRRDFLDPFEHGTRLAGTRNDLGTYLQWLVLECGGVKRPLVFFDIAGEDYRNQVYNSRSTRFLVNAGAVLFVEDAAHVLHSAAEQQDLAFDGSLANPLGANATNEYVQEAKNRLRGGGVDLPCAVAVTKSDRLRYVSPADRWLRHDPGGGLSATDLLSETRDVYALFHGNRAADMMELYHHFRRCTMHFVSATGGAVSENTFPAGMRPMRVLAPLLALFAMAGLPVGPDAGLVGR
ncbi:hypothetical protein [Actinokineospora enzanensis]|uniref:TRAFAC clade GTPase domain-containing protein n=1 Tax=Actinokineospora enzanensis TaxID=155975 RepID=UPI000361FAA1|nr:hypothetical protein [Actinokineospora enzanensis]